MTEEAETDKAEYASDEMLLSEISEKASYSYPYSDLSGIPIKYTASSMNRENNNNYLASENPAFLGEKELTPAQRGTLMHRFMEVCDLETARESLEAETARLVNEKLFTETEASALDKSKLSRFFESELFERIQSAEGFMREQEFTMSVPLSCVSDLKTEEYAVVQGVIDGLIINGENGEIVDYKTDRAANEEELCEKYRQQMYIYKKAAEECFGLKKVSVTLYSFSLSKEIFVKF